MIFVRLQTASTPTPGTGPGELVEVLPTVTRLGWFLVGLLVTIVAGWYLLDPLVARAVRKRNQNNPTIQEAVSRYLRLLVVVVGLFVGAAMAGYGSFVSDSALVVAAVTLAVGVAGQTVIGSIVSGLVLVTDPEFNVGNYIEWDDGEGTVQSITLRVTRVETPTGGLVTIPNTVLTNQAISRPYSRRRRQLTDRVGIAYEDDIDTALDVLRRVVREVDGVREEPAPNAYVDELSGDAVVLGIRYWANATRETDLFAVRSRFVQSVKRELDAAGITISPASKRELNGRIEVAGGDDADSGSVGHGDAADGER